MRRLFGAATLCAAFLVLTGVAAAGPQHDVRAGQHEPMSAHAPAADVIAGKTGFAPLGARLATATVTVHGTLRDSSGAYVVGADMEWDSWVGAAENRWYWGEGTTGTGGAFSMTAVPTANGEVWAYPDADSTLARGGRTWADGGSYDESLYPGRVSVTAHARRSLGRLHQARRAPFGHRPVLQGRGDRERRDVDAGERAHRRPRRRLQQRQRQVLLGRGRRVLRLDRGDLRRDLRHVDLRRRSHRAAGLDAVAVLVLGQAGRDREADARELPGRVDQSRDRLLRRPRRGRGQGRSARGRRRVRRPRR